MFKNPFSFEGRIRRKEYGISIILYAIGAGFIKVTLETDHQYSSFLGVGYIPLLWFLWAQNAKRCHDVGNSGWYQIIPLYFFWLLFEGGQRGNNEYGSNPKEENPIDQEDVLDRFQPEQ